MPETTRAPSRAPERPTEDPMNGTSFAPAVDRSDLQRGVRERAPGAGRDPLVITRNSTGTSWGVETNPQGGWTAVQREYSSNQDGRLVVSSRTLVGNGAMPRDFSALPWDRAEPSTVTMSNVRTPVTIPEGWQMPSFSPTAATTLAQRGPAPREPEAQRPQPAPDNGPAQRTGLTITPGVSGSTFWAGGSTDGTWQAVRRDYSADSDGRLIVSSRTVTGTGALPRDLQGLDWERAKPSSVTMENVKVPVTIPSAWSSGNFVPAADTRLPPGGMPEAQPAQQPGGAAPQPAPARAFFTSFGAAGASDGTWTAVRRDYSASPDGNLVVTSRTIEGRGAMPRNLRELDFSRANPDSVTMDNVPATSRIPQAWSYPNFTPTAGTRLP